MHHMPDRRTHSTVFTSFPSLDLGNEGNAQPDSIEVLSHDPRFLQRISATLLGMGVQVKGRSCRDVRPPEEPGTKPAMILLDCRPECGLDASAYRTLRADTQLAGIPVLCVMAPTGLTATTGTFGPMAPGDASTGAQEGPPLLTAIRDLLAGGTGSRPMRPPTPVAAVKDSPLRRLQQVRRGQQRLLTQPGTITGLHTAARLEPVLEAGGDFYEILRVSDDSYSILVADVAGHDMDVAYMTGALKALIQTYASEALTVEETLLLMNATLQRILPESMFVTACYAKVFPDEHRMEVGVAGNPSPLIERRGGPVSQLDLTGDILGPFETPTFGTESLTLDAGDRVFFYTDGLVENCVALRHGAVNRAASQQYLLEMLASQRGMPLQQTVDAVVEELIRRSAGALHDDIVLVALEV